jgi:hypothetical protein
MSIVTTRVPKEFKKQIQEPSVNWGEKVGPISRGKLGVN